MEWTHFVEPIASTAIDLGLKATLIVAFTGLAIRLLTRRRPAWSCLLWSATLVKRFSAKSCDAFKRQTTENSCIYSYKS